MFACSSRFCSITQHLASDECFESVPDKASVAFLRAIKTEHRSCCRYTAYKYTCEGFMSCRKNQLYGKPRPACTKTLREMSLQLETYEEIP